MLRFLLALTVTALTTASVRAQNPPAWTFGVPQPAADSFDVTRELAFQPAGEDPLRLDIYKPRNADAREAPVVVFMTPARTSSFYIAWAQYAASQGVVAILPDIRPPSFERDFDALLDHLTREHAALGLNVQRLVIYCASGVASAALPLIQNPRRRAIKAAVVYYGLAPIERYRLDLPMLLVRAGLDRPSLNRVMADMIAAATVQNAPITILNNATGYHAFESANHDEVTRDTMERTIDFVKRATAPGYQAALQRGVPEAAAAALFATGRMAEAAAAYAPLVAAQPDAATLRLAYLEALLGAARFAAACAEAAKLKGRGLGPRDLGLPAARACMQTGDADAAIAWLKTIPTRFLPPAVQDEPVFAAIKDRPDFRALFPPR